MLQSGIVKKIYKNTAEVEITRSSACGESCAACGLCPGKTARVIAVNKTGAAPGDTVLIDMSDKKVLGAAFLVYIIPIILLIAGYAAGSVIFKPEAVSILCGFILMAAAFAVIIAIDKKIRNRYMPSVVKIIDKQLRQK